MFYKDCYSSFQNRAMYMLYVIAKFNTSVYMTVCSMLKLTCRVPRLLFGKVLTLQSLQCSFVYSPHSDVTFCPNFHFCNSSFFSFSFLYLLFDTLMLRYYFVIKTSLKEYLLNDYRE